MKRPSRRSGSVKWNPMQTTRRDHDEDPAWKSPRQNDRTRRRPWRGRWPGGRYPANNRSNNKAAPAAHQRGVGKDLCDPGRAIQLRAYRYRRTSQRAPAVNAVFLDTVGLIAVWDLADQWNTAADAAYQIVIQQGVAWRRRRSFFGNAATPPHAVPSGSGSTRSGTICFKKGC